MPKFYFTYGIGEEQPYKGGWTEVVAPSLRVACRLFRAVHPGVYSGPLKCSDVYTEDEFKNTRMFKDGNGNFGKFCQEIIKVMEGEDYGCGSEENEPSDRVSEETEKPDDEF